MILWQNNTLAKWYFGKMIFWQSNTLAKWYLGIHTGRFPNKHTVQSKRFCRLVHEMTANWMAEEPPIQRSIMIFSGKTAARTSWSKRTPQEPELCATKSGFDLLIQLRRICSLHQGWCKNVQDWVTFLSSWVPGRRDAAVHEHALKSCAAHTGFPCKDRSAKLEFEIVLVMKTMSVALSIGLCCVINVIVRKCCGLRLAVPSANKPTPSEYSNRSANIQH